MLLWPDPRPLVERLGADFFRQAPQRAGVYLMRDAADTVLYVGKAKNLRQRLRSYRVANPDRMARRHLRLLRAVKRIELRECADEASALASEAELLRSLRPRFNRAGTWPGALWLLLWRVSGEGLEVAVKREGAGVAKSEARNPKCERSPKYEVRKQTALPWLSEFGFRPSFGLRPSDFGLQGVRAPDWHMHGPVGAGVVYARAALVRLLWSALQPERALAQMPEGWFRGHHDELVTVPRPAAERGDCEDLEARLEDLFAGQTEPFAGWIRERVSRRVHPFELTVIAEDLETVGEFVRRTCLKISQSAV
jgi:predicted GIY-YIG superfamily endonuclease